MIDSKLLRGRPSEVAKRLAMLPFRREDVCVLRPESQALEEVLIILDAGIRASRKPALRLESTTQTNLRWPAISTTRPCRLRSAWPQLYTLCQTTSAQNRITC